MRADEFFQGIARMVAEKEARRCPTCHKDTTDEKFRDVLSVKEYRLTGMCQKCQDDFYDAEEEDEDEEVDEQ